MSGWVRHMDAEKQGIWGSFENGSNSGLSLCGFLSISLSVSGGTGLVVYVVLYQICHAGHVFLFGIMHCFPGHSKGWLCPCLLWVGKVCFLVRFSPVFILSPKTPSDHESDPSSLRGSGQRTELACLLYLPNGLPCNWLELWSLSWLILWGDTILWHPLVT